MTLSVRLSTLSVLLLGFLLNGCASTGKGTPAADVTNNNANAPKNSTTEAGSASATQASTGATPGAANANKVAAADKGAALNRKNEPVSNGPVFKNGAPPASYPTINKKDPWESMNRSI